MAGDTETPIAARLSDRDTRASHDAGREAVSPAPRVLILSMSLAGGAGGAARRLQRGLERLGVPARLLVQTGSAEHDPTVVAAYPTRPGRQVAARRPRADRLPVVAYPRRDRMTLFSPQWLPESLHRKVARLHPDVVNLHWVRGGFLRPESVPRLPVPLVWTLHDMAPFTGGCDYSQSCEGYLHRCGRCPALRSDRDDDLSRWVWQRKRDAWQDLDAVFVTPSTWLARCASSSSLLAGRRIEVIPNGLDTAVFRPRDRRAARALLRLPLDRRLVLFGASSLRNPRKGFDLLLPALRALSTSALRDDVELVAFGSDPPVRGTGLPTHWFGYVQDEHDMALLYAAADVMVVPSIWDNLPQTATEALACGTPVVAFAGQTGLPDVVDHRETGFLASPFAIQELAEGISWVVGDPARARLLSENARRKALREYALEVQAARYRDLFVELAQDPRRTPARRERRPAVPGRRHGRGPRGRAPGREAARAPGGTGDATGREAARAPGGTGDATGREPVRAPGGTGDATGREPARAPGGTGGPV